MGPPSLGRPKWGGSTWTKDAHMGKAPRRKLPPRGGSFLPPSLAPHQREGNPRGHPLRLPPPPRWPPLPSHYK